VAKGPADGLKNQDFFRDVLGDDTRETLRTTGRVDGGHFGRRKKRTTKKGESFDSPFL
jgi:hypothetical protein